MAQDVFLGGLAPCGAELVEQHRQGLFRCGQKRLDGAAGVFCQHLRCRVHTAAHGGHDGLGRGEARAGGKGLAPCAELPVSQPARQGQPEILPIQLHLPAAALRGGGCPCHAVGGILHRAKRHKAAHRKAAHAAEPHTVGGVALPAWLQLQILGGFGHQAPLGAPCRTQTVDLQAFGRKSFRKRRQTAQRKARQHLQRVGFAAGIFHTRHDLGGGVIGVEGQRVGVGKPARVGQFCHNDSFIGKILCSLPGILHGFYGGAVAHRAPAAEKRRGIVLGQLGLN